MNWHVDRTTPGWVRPTYHQCKPAGCTYGPSSGQCDDGCVIDDLEHQTPQEQP